MTTTIDRCPWAIRFGVTLHTRCHLSKDHDGAHLGKGLAEFPYQEVEWAHADRREYPTARADEHAWESPTDARGSLP